MLCHDDIGWRLALFVITGSPIDDLQYTFLGHNKKRATIKDLVHPCRSPLVLCQARLFKLAKSFHGGENSEWHLASLLGADLNSENMRVDARRSLLQLSSGLVNVFELRMAIGLYRACWSTFEDLGADTRSGAIDEVFDSPRECLSFVCRQLLEASQTRHEFHRVVPAVCGAFGEACITGIDLSERTHA